MHVVRQCGESHLSGMRSLMLVALPCISLKTTPLTNGQIC